MKTKDELIAELNAKRSRCEVYSRIVGYVRPVRQWNISKVQEFKDRKLFKIEQVV